GPLASAPTNGRRRAHTTLPFPSAAAHITRSLVPHVLPPAPAVVVILDLSTLALWAARAPGTVAGVLLPYAAFFVYPGERRRVHSTLESWWWRLDQTRGGVAATFLHGVARSARAGLLWAFGPVRETRFFLVTCLLSLACAAP